MQTTTVIRETIIYLHQHKKLPGSPSRRTVARWIHEGRRSSDGRRITLEWALLGGLPITSVEAFDRFLQRLNGEMAPARERKKS